VRNGVGPHFWLFVCLLASPAAADETLEPSATTAAPATNYINLRLGGATSDSTGRPTICLDATIARGFGFETCGTGQGIIHDQTGVEMAHFRATYALLSRATNSGTARLRAGLGWAELQVGTDHPGFRFNSPDAARGSVAGPEAAAQGQWLVPLAKGVEAVASLTVGAAAFAGARELEVPQSTVQPFASFEIGLGW
jgi:hypothetical protein